VLGEGQKANFGFAASRIFYGGGRAGCHLTFYQLADEQATGYKFQADINTPNPTVTQSQPVAFPSISGVGPVKVARSVGYYC
jgi:hypothetical protein